MPNAAVTRTRILDAAVRRIAHEGIDEVRIARIATDAGVSPALVHYHFETREALLVEALEHSYELAGAVRTPLPEAGSARERLHAMIDACLPEPGPQRDDWLLWVELWLRAARHPELADTSTQLYARLHGWFAEVVGELVPADEVDAATDRILALIDGLGLRVLIGDATMSLDAARQQVRAVIG